MTLSIAGSLTAPVTVGWLVETVSWSAAFVFGGVLALGGIAAVAGLSES
jgi:dipeptide/tripeptide permease